MIRLIKRLLDFSGKERRTLIAAFIFSLLDSVFEMLPVMAILTVLSGLLTSAGGGVMPVSAIWGSFLIMVVSIAGRIFFNNLSCTRRTLGSFAMCADKRLEIGEHMKHVPMGYFSENRLGEIAAAVTTTLGDIENNAVTVLEKVAGGFIHAIVIIIWLLFYEWHIGLLSLAGLVISLLVYDGIQKAGNRLSPRRQAAQASLVTGILEYIQGMGVVKAFGLGETSGKAVHTAIEESASANIHLESTFSSLTGIYQTVFKLIRAAILVVVPYLLSRGEITPVNCLLLLVSSFMIYSSVEMVGSMTSIARVIDASLDRLDKVMDAPVMDERGSDITPEHFDIELNHVSFAYGQENVIQDVSMQIPERTTCAIIGPSGSGKTTLASLVARFWDVQEGSIRVGGHDVKEYTCDSLLRNFSIVFQNVYLFEDTIENNIKFGCPDATHEMVVEAAKKACCHDFITAFPDGYKTLVGEGGASLSGGERQRISIARAILKDAPIVILDEATASVDPENERELQLAIAELTKDKTILMIAHRLSTIRGADQILVLDKGRIVQRGTHQELIQQQGIYRRFVNIKEQAIGWKLGTNIAD
ncbi:ABC transporter ATP-binding protein [Bianquea renquensis]|jgi:ABC transporter, ATP-binding protein|uniref:ABC transporter ATP-binding protein n=1 Tax=Bianquea renquensis TaxID=2763661 RepID=A0A926I382_9FIRM|nr:ABC transporter ATP-binding protein [Bianquea renquensis]MBC8544866.1 ABC transporter ATP-binding protein [Bianquea renquensis]